MTLQPKYTYGRLKTSFASSPLPQRHRRRRYRSNVVNLPLAYSVYYVLGIRNREARNSIDRRRSFPLTLLPKSSSCNRMLYTLR